MVSVGLMVCVKRFTDTDKWRDPWFRRLSPEHKLAWDYICTNCDNAGVWVIDWDLFEYMSGAKIIPSEVMAAFGDRVRQFGEGKLWILKFVRFQFGELSKESRVHQSVLSLIKHHGLDTLSIPYPEGINTPKDKDKDKDSTKDKDQKGESEGKRMPMRLHGIPSSPEEVIAYGATLNPKVPPQTCRDFFAHYEGQARTNQNGQLFWITGSSNETIITNWRAKLPSFGGIRSHANNRQPGQQGISASRGTANEGTASGYANARAIRKPLEAATHPVQNVSRPGVGGNGQGHDGVCNVDPIAPS